MTAITITDAGRRLYRDSTRGANTPLIKYVAVGTGTTAPSTSDTQLVNEVYRKAVTSYVNGAAPGEVIVSMFLGAGDANGQDIEEIGFYGGSAATGIGNSGVLVAHGLYSVNPKTINQNVQIQLDLNFS